MQKSPVDEFGISHHNISYNEEVDKLFRLLDAPSKDAVEKHHNKAGIKCGWVIQVKTTS